VFPNPYYPRIAPPEVLDVPLELLACPDCGRFPCVELQEQQERPAGPQLPRRTRGASGHQPGSEAQADEPWATAFTPRRPPQEVAS
jgi:hypothetical protein